MTIILFILLSLITSAHVMSDNGLFMLTVPSFLPEKATKLHCLCSTNMHEMMLND